MEDYHILAHLRLLHWYCHNLEHDPEDTITIAVTAREMAMIAYGLCGIELSSECLLENVREFRNRVEELWLAQGKPKDWGRPDGEE